MISRKTAMLIAEIYTYKFSYRPTSAYGGTSPKIYKDALYDFLFEREYDSWLCNAAKQPLTIRGLKEWFLRLHTGETLAKGTQAWSWKQREKLGQQYLRNLARDFLVYYTEDCKGGWTKEKYSSYYEELQRHLEIDGYVFRDRDLYQSEIDIVDVEQEKGLIEKLHCLLDLPDRATTFRFFELSEEHYLEGRWSDCIANSRKFFEAILQQIAVYVAEVKNKEPSSKRLERPFEVRNFLEEEGLLEKKEKEAIDKIYNLLSHTGSHPYMAEKDQARLLRQISLSMTQFVMLRLEGLSKSK